MEKNANENIEEKEQPSPISVEEETSASSTDVEMQEILGQISETTPRVDGGDAENMPSTSGLQRSRQFPREEAPRVPMHNGCHHADGYSTDGSEFEPSFFEDLNPPLYETPMDDNSRRFNSVRTPSPPTNSPTLYAFSDGMTISLQSLLPSNHDDDDDDGDDDNLEHLHVRNFTRSPLRIIELIPELEEDNSWPFQSRDNRNGLDSNHRRGRNHYLLSHRRLGSHNHPFAYSYRLSRFNNHEEYLIRDNTDTDRPGESMPTQTDDSTAIMHATSDMNVSFSSSQLPARISAIHQLLAQSSNTVRPHATVGQPNAAQLLNCDPLASYQNGQSLNSSSQPSTQQQSSTSNEQGTTAFSRRLPFNSLPNIPIQSELPRANTRAEVLSEVSFVIHPTTRSHFPQRSRSVNNRPLPANYPFLEQVPIIDIVPQGDVSVVVSGVAQPSDSSHTHAMIYPQPSTSNAEDTLLLADQSSAANLAYLSNTEDTSQEEDSCFDIKYEDQIMPYCLDRISTPSDNELSEEDFDDKSSPEHY